MSKYQITLTPVDKFFFGGDMSFAVKGLDSQYISYIIQSSMFPQQTSLLGMLRFLILRNAGEAIFKNNRIVDKEKAARLIGGRSFAVNAENDFKAIKNVSHIRVRRSAFGQVADLEFAPLLKDLCLDNASKGTYNLEDVSVPALSEKQYDAKKGLKVQLTDGRKEYALDEVFLEDHRIGISRDIKTGKVEDSALFKQVSYRFNDKIAKHCFVFEAEISDDIPFASYSGQVVSVGGDNSQFVIGISDTIEVNESIKPLECVVWLLSPTYLPRAEARTASFAVTRLLPFRFLESAMDKVQSYNVLSGELKRSKRYELYAPGSVFYFEDENGKEQFTALLEAKTAFRKIGYNEYK